MANRDHSGHRRRGRAVLAVAGAVSGVVAAALPVGAAGPEPAAAPLAAEATGIPLTGRLVLSANPATRLAPVPAGIASAAATIELRATIAASFAFTAAATAPSPVAGLLALGFPGDLGQGDHSAAVQAVQQRLVELHFEPGPIDGNFGADTTTAVQSFQKITGRDPTGVVDADLWDALQQPLDVAPMVEGAGATRAEVDLDRQLLVLWVDGQVRLVTRVSTGALGVTPTPPGRFHVQRRVRGWDPGPHGALYNPLYFNGGIAFHGFASVPLRPASHGCVRIPMVIAEYFPSLIDNGTEVYVVDARHPGIPFDQPAPEQPPPPADAGA
jgi:peptidoglycan hydrolase-like protein with peptidoglycan-binding domain